MYITSFRVTNKKDNQLKVSVSKEIPGIRSSVQPNLALSRCAESISSYHCINSWDNAQKVLKVSKFTALSFLREQFLMNELPFLSQKGKILLVFRSWVWKSNQVKFCGTISGWCRKLSTISDGCLSCHRPPSAQLFTWSHWNCYYSNILQTYTHLYVSINICVCVHIYVQQVHSAAENELKTFISKKTRSAWVERKKNHAVVRANH